MKYIIIVFAVLLISCTKQANHNLRQNETRQNNGHGHNQVEATLAVMTLTHTGGTFTIDYGGATDAIRVFLRSGDSLYSNGNLYPANAQLYIPAPVGAFSTWVSGAMYQAVVVTGTEERDANGILGTNWVFTYTNVAQ